MCRGSALCVLLTVLPRSRLNPSLSQIPPTAANQYSNKRWCCMDQVWAPLGTGLLAVSACMASPSEPLTFPCPGSPLSQTHFDVSVWAWEKLADKKWGVIGERFARIGSSAALPLSELPACRRTHA
jgi:hypothetical protein